MRQISRLLLTAIILAAPGAILAQWAATFRGGISFREALFLSWLLFGAIFFLAGLAQWSRMALRSYGVSPGQPWGAPIAAYGAPGLRRPSPFGPPLPWEGRRDSAGRLVVFTAFEGFVVGGLLIALSLVRTPVLTELIGGCPHEELLGRTCSPMRGEGLSGTGNSRRGGWTGAVP